jgi:hypothetical protein
MSPCKASRSNFRLFFTKDRKFNGERVRNCMNGSAGFHRHILPLHDGDMEECIEDVRRLFLKGL